MINYTIDRRCDFTQVKELEQFGPCTPTFTTGEGIVLNAPESVTFEVAEPYRCMRGPFWICGTTRFRYDTADLKADFMKRILFVVVDMRSHKARTGILKRVGTIIHLSEVHDEATKTGETTNHSGYLFQEAFNVDAISPLSYMPLFDLPPVDADYVLYAVLGPHVSNVLPVRLRRGDLGSRVTAAPIEAPPPSTRVTSTLAEPDSPHAATHFCGVEVAALSKIRAAGKLLLKGVFQLTEEARTKIDEQLHRSIVVVSWSKVGSVAFSPFRHKVLTSDDEERSGGVRRGYFTIEVIPDLSGLEGAEFYLSVSMGSFISNTVKVEVST